MESDIWLPSKLRAPWKPISDVQRIELGKGKLCVGLKMVNVSEKLFFGPYKSVQSHFYS